MDNVQIINSKLIPPSPSATYMRRSSFIKKMKVTSNYRLTILHSGPGFGKSLGLAQYFKDASMQYSWYTVTAEDDNFIPFVSYLKESIRRAIPTFGNTLPNLARSSTFLKEAELHQWLALFINELCHIDDSFTMIVDDFHLVDHVFQINIMMEKMIELLPPHVNIIIATRSCPKWSNLLKLKVKNHYYEMTKDDLIFSEEEITVYLEDYFNIEMEEEKAREIGKITEGWAIAINLIALQFSVSDLSFSKMMKPVYQNLFDYLSEEVFQRRSAKEQEWLLSFAIFPTFSVQLINEFYEEEAVFGLEKLALEHGFFQSLGEEDTYRYHALYKRFLTNKWLEINPKKFSLLHKKASNYFYRKGDFFQSTYHALQTNDDHFIAEVLVSTALPLIRSGQFDWFIEMYDQLAQTVKNEFYALFYFKGEVQRYRAFYEQARQAYVKCIVYAEQNEDAYYLSRSHAGIAHIFLDTIQPALAETHLKQAIDWAQRSDRMKEKEKAMLKRQFAENLVNLGRARDALTWVKAEQLPAAILREGNLDARIFLRMGKLVEAKKVLQEHIAIRKTLPDSHRETEVLLSLIYGMSGEVYEALQNAKKGVEIGKAVKSGFIEAVGYTRRGHAETLANPFILEDAEKSYCKAIDMMEKLKVARVKAEPLMGLAILKARQGQYQLAIHYGEAALQETEKVNDEWMSGLIQVSLGIIYFYQKDFERSEHHFVLAQQLFRSGGDLYGEMITLFWLMNIFFLVGELERLTYSSERFFIICIKENYLFFLKKNTMFGPLDRQIIYPIVNKIRELRPKDTYVHFIAKEINLDANVHHPGYYLFMRTFGRLQLRLGMDIVEEQTWQREKSKELLLYFLINKDRYIRKEEMMQALWESMDEKTADRNFKVTMNALLKVLEPNRQARQQSFFILRKNKMYRLSPQAEIVSDIDLFMQFAMKGLDEREPRTSIFYLLKACTVYKETPFEELRDSAWLIREKETLENKYIQVSERLAQNYLHVKDYNQVIKWAERLLKKDQTWEEAYRLLMFAYYRLQNRSQSIKWYEKCVAVLQNELNIHPMETTNELFQMITKSEE